MQVKVYRLRERGSRLPGATVSERGPATGDLVLRERITRSGILLAVLMDSRRDYVIPCMDRAKVVKIENHCLMITGTEVIPRSISSKSNISQHRQTWWCEPAPEGT